MKTSPHRYLLFALLGLAALQPAQAIVVNSTFAGATTDAEAASFSQMLASPFSNVVELSIVAGSRIFTCTGTLISVTTILTAKHCTRIRNDLSSITVTFDQDGDGALDVGIDQVNSVTSVFEALDAPSNPNLIDGTDLAMLTLGGSLPSWATSYQRLWDGNVLGLQATMVGYGNQGVNVRTPSTAGGSRWAAKNIIDKVGVAGFNQPNSANIISTDFDNGTPAADTLGGYAGSALALPTEGTTAGGDSGGPLLVDIGGEWLIAGVLSGGTRDDSGYGDISWWTGVSVYRADIERLGGRFFTAPNSNGVPEPASLALALLALLAVGGIGARRNASCRRAAD